MLVINGITGYYKLFFIATLGRKDIIMLNLNLFSQKPGVDFFQGGKTLSNHITGYMVNFVWKSEMGTVYGAEKSACTNFINMYKGLEDNDVLKTALKDDYDKKVARLNEINTEISETMKNHAFELTEADKTLRKVLSNRDGKTTMAKIKRELVAWYKSYGVECTEKTYIITATLESMGLKFNMNKFIESKAECGLTFDGATAFKNVWHIAYTYGVMAGTIKKADIPPMLQKNYDVVKALQEAKKAEQALKAGAKADRKDDQKFKAKRDAKQGKKANKRTNVKAENKVKNVA